MEHRTSKQPAGQENQNVRREEEANRRRKKRFKLNISKKNHRKKMEFQTATFLPLSFRRPQGVNTASKHQQSTSTINTNNELEQ